MEAFFPHLTSTGAAPTSRVILSAYRNAFFQDIYTGKIRPFVIPYNLGGLFLMIIYLCIPHKDHPWIYAARWPIVGLITWFQWYIIHNSSSPNYCIGFFSGLISAWVIVWSFCWLIFMQPQWDAKRVQRIKIRQTDENLTIKEKSNVPQYSMANGNANGNGRQRKIHLNGFSGPQGQIGRKTKVRETLKYFWQPYPDNLKERIPWVIDLVLNFRGPGWNWVISTLPSLPPDIYVQLGDPAPKNSYSSISPIGMKRFDTRQDLWRSRVPRFIFGYFLLDFLKVIMMKDPYYKFGPTTYALPAHLRDLSPFAIHMYRSSLSSGTIIAGLSVANYLPPLFISIILGPTIFGLRAEAWYYPSTWGPFSNISYKGLSGLWGNYWHQTFRQCFTAPLKYLIRLGIIKPRSPAAMIASLIFAFGISGFLHWAGSVSLYGKTYPVNLYYFFVLQCLGIVIQCTFCSVLKQYIEELPKQIRYAANLIYSLVWLYSTGWILADDLARGGLWLWEPIPFSPLRGLGFGEPDSRWSCWEYNGVGWYTGKHWWESGISI